MFVCVCEWRRTLERGLNVRDNSMGQATGRKLWLATHAQDESEVRRLINRGAPVEWQDEKGRAPLHVASGNGNTEIVTLLIENVTDINIWDRRGDTPLIYAAYHGQMGNVCALVEALCDIKICNDERKNAAEVARERGHHAIAEYLANEAPRVQVHSTHRAHIVL